MWATFSSPFFRRGAVGFAVDMAAVYFEKHVSRSAAELAYFLILTFFPILICLNAFLSLLHLDLAQMLQGMETFLPGGVAAILTDYVGYITTNESTALLIAGVLTAVFFAAAAVRGLMNLMEDIYGSATFHGLRRMAASFVISILLLVTIYASVAVVMTGNWFFHLIEDVFHLENIVERFGTFQWMKYLVLLGLLFVVVLLLYRASAPLDRPRPPVLAGAALASAALAAASLLFSWFIGLSARYSMVYGSLASVMILLVWLYLCGNILILGNVFNYVRFVRRGGRAAD